MSIDISETLDRTIKSWIKQKLPLTERIQIKQKTVHVGDISKEEKDDRARTGVPSSLAMHDMGLATVIGAEDRDAERRFDPPRPRLDQGIPRNSPRRDCGIPVRHLVDHEEFAEHRGKRTRPRVRL